MRWQCLQGEGLRRQHRAPGRGAGRTAVRMLKRCLSLAVLLVLGSCNTDTSPTSPFSCISVTGQYTGVFTDSCGLSKTEDVTLFQTSCTVVAQFPGVGSLQGSVDG